METIIWIVQGLLTLVFIMAGFMKLMMSADKLRNKMP